MRSSVPSILVLCRGFAHVYIDLVRTLPSASSQTYILMMIDHKKSWPEATPLTSISAESCAGAFISTWITRFGIPALLTSDLHAPLAGQNWVQNLSLVLLGL